MRRLMCRYNFSTVKMPCKVNIKESFKKLIQEISFDIPLFIYAISGPILYGNGSQTKLMLWKVCSVIKGYNETVCDNLKAEEYDDVQNEVQVFQNNFSIKDHMLASWPTFIYAFFAGALSDRFGRKWLVCLPVLGVFISTIFQLIHYAFIRELPMEFFYLDNWYAYMGGWTMYYMGLYSYGSDISTPENRAQRLARFDGIEFIAGFFGTLLSPHIFKAGGYYALYLIRLIFVGVALVYWLKIIKSPEELGIVREGTKDSDTAKGELPPNSWNSKVRHFTKTFVWEPMKELWHTMTVKRPNNLRLLIYINYVLYFFYITNYAYAGERYLYMSKVFEDFSGEKFANMYAMEQVLSVIGLMVIIPVCVKKLHMHELALQMFVCVSMAAGLTCAGLSRNLFPQFILSIAVTSTHTWQWSLCRSVFTKMVSKAEVGKVFTVLALMGALLPLAATPLYKKLYNATIATVPATFLYYTASVYLAALVLVIFLFFHRSRFAFGQDEEEDKDPNGNELKEKDTAENQI